MLNFSLSESAWRLLKSYNLGHSSHKPELGHVFEDPKTRKLRDQQACTMELVSYIADEPWSDHPRCVQGMISDCAIGLNDSAIRIAEDDDAALKLRNRLKKLIPLMIGTSSESYEIRKQREAMLRPNLEIGSIVTWKSQYRLLKKALMIGKPKAPKKEKGTDTIATLKPGFIYQWPNTYLSQSPSLVVMENERLYFVDKHGFKKGQVMMASVGKADQFKLVGLFKKQIAAPKEAEMSAEMVEMFEMAGAMTSTQTGDV